MIRQYIVERDIHPFVKGIEYDEVWNSRVEGDYQGVSINFAGLDALIKMKKAANRPKDIEDLKILKKLKSQKKV